MRERREIMEPSFVGWIAIGSAAGWLTEKLTRGAGHGILMDLILGLTGAVISGWIFSWLGIISYGFMGSLAAAIVGAVILLRLRQQSGFNAVRV
jgi:uncharacterized membrane protein YeaQ/YmgE (transglycosylase-associated protein family)